MKKTFPLQSRPPAGNSADGFPNNSMKIIHQKKLLLMSCLGMALLVLSTPAARANNWRSDQRFIYAVTTANELIGFYQDRLTQIPLRVPITNLRAGESILAIDVRPANGWLYGLGSSSQLYLINSKSGVASRIGAQFATPLSGNSFGFDFNPTVDRVRIVSNTGQNLRVHPDLGEVVSVDGPLAYAAGDINVGKAPGVVGAAYTNPDNDPATATTLYDLELTADFLVVQNPPNSGALNSTGPLLVNIGTVTGFDIGLPYTRTNLGAAFAAQGGPIAAIQPVGTTGTRLYTIDLVSGRATDRGEIGINVWIRGIALALPIP